MSTCSNGGCAKLGDKRCGGCGQTQYCSTECQRAHWSSGGHKTACKAMKQASTKDGAATTAGTSVRAPGPGGRSPADKPSRHPQKGSSGSGSCIICLEDSPVPIQSGCACRGDAGLAHPKCRIEAAAVDPGAGGLRWSICSTCDQVFTGEMELALARERWRRAQHLPETVREHGFALVCLANALIKGGKIDESETILRASRVGLTRAFGATDPVVGTINSSLATVLGIQGNFAEAEIIFRVTHAQSARQYGKDSKQTASSATDLANVLMSQRKFNEALPLFEASFATFNRICGPEDYFTMSAALNMAGAYTDMRQYHEAEAMFLHHLPVLKRVLGPEHLKTLDATINYARTIALAGRIAEGETMLVKTHAVLVRVYGSEHPTTQGAAQRIRDVRDFAQSGLKPPRKNPKSVS